MKNKKNTDKKKKNTITYRNIEDLPEDDWIGNLGPMIIYSHPSTKSSSETQSSSEEQNTSKDSDNSRILAKQEGKELAKRILARLGTTKIGTNRKPHKPLGESFLFFVRKEKPEKEKKNEKKH